MCSGRVDPSFVLKAFALGADGVLIAGCHPGDCHYIEQNYKTMRRHAMLRYFLEQMGIEPDRLRLVWASAAEGQYLAESIDQFVADVQKLGPLELVRRLGRRTAARGGLRGNRRRTRRSDGGSSMNGEPKGKLALYWAASCGGCEIAVLAINEKILDVDALFDIVFWPVAVDAKVHDVEKMADGSIDVCLFNGGIRTSEQEYMARLLRKKSKVLVAFGSCATKGCIPGLANATNRRANLRHRLPRHAVDREPRPHRAATQDRDARGDAAPAGVLRHAADAGSDGGGGLLPARLPARGRAHLGRDHGDRRQQPAAAGLGDRRRDHGLPRMPAEAERKEDQEVLPHLGDHPGRRDVPVGAGAAVLRDRHPGRLRGPLSAGRLALHRLLRPERGHPRSRRPDDGRARRR